MKFIILVVFLIGTSLAEEEKPKEVIQRTEEEHKSQTLADGADIFSHVVAAHDDAQPDPAQINDQQPEEVKRDQRQILTTTTLHQPLLYINSAEQYYHHPYNLYYNPLIRLNPTYYYEPLKTIHPSYVVQTLAKK